MEYHFFRISAVDPAQAQDDLNRLCAERGARIEAAAVRRQTTPAEAQRTYDGLLATVAGAETSGFRRRLGAECGDKPWPYRYNAVLGCGSR